MAEYIKREDAIDICTKCVDFQDSIENINASAEAMRIRRLIKEMPSADVVPRKDYESMERTVDKLNKALAERKHGKWETVYLDQVYAGCRPRAIYCSNCHIVSAFKTPFCPNCGADMRERDEKEM